ncbi:hypothetical protein EVAR_78320_1 [Eumeta japonica]|uniref:Uncharacterized protein n=1 Tax=Eumeta variegata TaxID=151549 RepID=A0A4C1T3E9_EUMVA|nr:hypothetical protein EVAR_78320_1 [Eumeta japonica]
MLSTTTSKLTTRVATYTDGGKFGANDVERRQLHLGTILPSPPIRTRPSLYNYNGRQLCLPIPLVLKRGRTNLTNDLREGRPSTATANDISAVPLMIETDKRVTYQKTRTSSAIEESGLLTSRKQRPVWKALRIDPQVRADKMFLSVVPSDAAIKRDLNEHYFE